MKFSNKKINIIFIDDEKSENQKLKIKNLESKFYCTVESIILFELSLDQFVEKLQNRRKVKPDIILMDHNLVEMLTKLITGASLSEIIKEMWPSIPIVSVTNVDINKDISESKKRVYDEIIEKDELLNTKYKIIESIAKSYLSMEIAFKSIKSKKPVNEENIRSMIYSWLGVPEVEFEKLNRVIPREIIKFGISKIHGQSDFISLLARWIRKEFIAFPGFVYDSLWIATILGLTESGFQKIKNRFKSALYTGPFYQEKELWWKSKVKKQIYNYSVKMSDKAPNILGKKYNEINEKNFVKCQNCGDLLPDIVGYLDDSMGKRVPIHLKCSILSNKVTPRLFFEDVRIMEGE